MNAATSRIKKLAEHALSAFYFLFALAIFAASAWTVYSRSFDSIYRYGGRIALPVFVLFLVLGFIAYSIKNEDKDPSWWRKPANLIVIVCLAAIGSLVGGFMYYSAGVALMDAYQWTTSLLLSRDQRLVVVAMITLAVGSGLFTFRLHFRALYGITEVIVGVFIGTLKIAQNAQLDPEQAAELSSVLPTLNTDAYIAVLTAGIYLVVRGLDNIHQGIYKEPRDLLVGRLVDWLHASPAPPPSAK